MCLELEVNGEPPPLDGRVCEGLIAEEYWHNGVIDEPANVVWLRFNRTWHRLYFDCGIVFWRTAVDEPRPYTMPELHAEVKLADLGKMLGIAGDILRHYEMRPVSAGSEVQFSFESGRVVVFKNVDDRTTYAG